MIPVALASVSAAAARLAIVGSEPMFPLAAVSQPGRDALAFYVVLGAGMGLAAVAVTRLVYGIEDAFALLPLHWMWWPALGAVVVGGVGLVAPTTLGVGYANIRGIVGGDLAADALVLLCAMKLVAWAVALGSGTSGGTLAPLFTIGGALGAACGALVLAVVPSAGVDVRLAGLVGMAALFAGASRALLASVVFAFETTQQPAALLPLLGGCATAYLVSCRLMSHSIMTEKIARRGVRVTGEYAADLLDRVRVGDTGLRPVVVLRGGDRLAAVRARVLRGDAGMAHQGFPVVDDEGGLVGVVTRRDLLDPAHDADAAVASVVRRAPLVVAPDASLRQAADVMVRENVGRLPVVERGRVVGIVTRSDLLAAHLPRLEDEHLIEARRSG